MLNDVPSSLLVTLIVIAFALAIIAVVIYVVPKQHTPRWWRNTRKEAGRYVIVLACVAAGVAGGLYLVDSFTTQYNHDLQQAMQKQHLVASNDGNGLWVKGTSCSFQAQLLNGKIRTYGVSPRTVLTSDMVNAICDAIRSKK
jgi:hypothetical protein